MSKVKKSRGGSSSGRRWTQWKELYARSVSVHSGSDVELGMNDETI